MPITLRFAPAALACLALVACDPVDEPLGDPFEEVDDASERFYVIGGFGSGRRLNTNHIEMHEFSEFDLTGAEHEGTELLWVRHDDGWGPIEVDPASIVVVGGALEADRADGMRLYHSDFNDSEWRVRTHTAQGPREYTLTVETGFHAPSNTPLYSFYYDLGFGEDRVSTCNEPDEGPELTAAVYRDINVDRWSGDMWEQADLLYIGCTNAAVGKASLWHYRPEAFGWWHPYPVEMFEAAVRMIRADFCGDGGSHTMPGTPVLVGDKMWINSYSSGNAIEEAVWGASGALCVDTPRGSGPFVVRPTCSNGSSPPVCPGGAHNAFHNDPNGWFVTAQ